MRNTLDRRYGENKNKRVIFSDNVEKCGTSRKVTGNNIMLLRRDVICMLDNEGTNKDTHS
jgi:hypothetical protein